MFEGTPTTVNEGGEETDMPPMTEPWEIEEAKLYWVEDGLIELICPSITVPFGLDCNNLAVIEFRELIITSSLFDLLLLAIYFTRSPILVKVISANNLFTVILNITAVRLLHDEPYL